MLRITQVFLAQTVISMICIGTLPATTEPTSGGRTGPATAAMTMEETTMQQRPSLTDEEISKLSETFGHFITRNLENPVVKFDLARVIKGMKDCSIGKAAPMTEEEFEEILTTIQDDTFEKLAETNLQDADYFMATNVSEEGIVEVEPGKLQYKVLTEGSGPGVMGHSTPLIHYTGACLDGTVFGSSEEMGGPLTIPLDQTIPGFAKGIVGMKEGEKRQIFVHPSLGYGKGGNLPPNSLLTFEVEVVKASPQELGQAAAISESSELAEESSATSGTIPDPWVETIR